MGGVRWIHYELSLEAQGADSTSAFGQEADIELGMITITKRRLLIPPWVMEPRFACYVDRRRACETAGDYVLVCRAQPAAATEEPGSNADRRALNGARTGTASLTLYIKVFE